jgi:hypothetical protein
VVASGVYFMTTVTTQEIAQFRIQLADYPAAIAALDGVEECGGHLEDALTLLIMRETDREPDRGFSEIVQKCRTIMCEEEFRNDLVGGLLGVVIEPVAISVGIPPSVATVIVIYAYKIGMKRFCESIDSKL